MRPSRYSVSGCRINAASVSLRPRDCDTCDPASVFSAACSPEESGASELFLYSSGHCSIKRLDARGSCYCDASADETLTPKDVAFSEQQPSHSFLIAAEPGEIFMLCWDFLGLIRTASLAGATPCLIGEITQIESV